MGGLPVIDLSVLDRTKAALLEVAAYDGPIIVGPWLSEIGFEVLYWVPWLRWAMAHARIDPARVTIVSRGGSRAWYAGIGANYVDVLEFYTPDEFRAGDNQRITEQASRWDALGLKPNHRTTKQITTTGFDADILAKVRAAAGLTDATVLHPSLMFGYFRPYWKRQSPRLYHRSTIRQRLRPVPRVLDLPPTYIAAKFYTSHALEDTAANRDVVQRWIDALAATDDVVLLHSGTRYDDHGEFPVADHPRVHRVALPPALNLEIQTAIIAGASRFVGTYGGFAYLAPFLGVPTSALFGLENFRRDHRDLMALVARVDLKVPFELRSVRHRLRSLKRAA